jgi:hypothetical protein
LTEICACGRDHAVKATSDGALQFAIEPKAELKTEERAGQTAGSNNVLDRDAFHHSA